ncbi:DUF6625 family protein [Leuconostoc lactis]|uniref:DUF6625 family protein n=1 Tax=Leuconostoc lactis TaxID=1246 RepID=UPI003D6AA566
MKIALIIVYFGNFPEYFPAFLKSAATNQDFDFLIYSDNSYNQELLPNNVKIINSDFEILKSQIQKLFDFKISLSKPYKLTDFKPVYGQIFESEIKDYTHWGYFDLDIILGDLIQFVTLSDLSNFDKIGGRGHLSIFKNNEKNRLAYRRVIGKNAFQFDEALSNRYSYHFDEMWGINSVYATSDFKFKDDEDIPYFDASPKRYPLISVRGNELKKPSVVLWEDGKLYLNGEKEKQLAYIHLQKRKIKYYSERNLTSNQMLIDQNSIISGPTFDQYDIQKRIQAQKKKWPEGELHHLFKYYYNTIVSGEQFSRIKLIKKRFLLK